MIIKTYPKNCSAQEAFGLIGRALLLLALACIGSTALAQNPGLFVPAPGFAGGQVALDAHSADLTGPFQGSTGQAIALLGSTDVVQAALVRHPDGNQTNNLWNVGLLRFDKATGNRVAWTNPTPAYARFGNQYLIFPNTSDAAIGAIAKVLVRGSTILVLVEAVYNNQKRLQILRFNTSGQYLGRNEVFLNLPDLYVSAGSMALYSSGLFGGNGGVQLVVVGSTQFGQTITPMFRRFQLDENTGTLTPRTGMVEINFPICNSALACRAHSIAFGFRGLSVPTIYISGNASFANPAREVVALMRIDQDGVRDSSWNPNNRPISNFEDGRYPEQATPIGIAVHTSGFGLPNSPFVDQVLVASAVKRFCQPGVSVARIDDDQDFSTTTFIFGGSSSNSNACVLGGPDAYEPRGFAFDGERIYISGEQRSSAVLLPGQDRPRSSFVSVVGRTTMDLESRQKFSYPFGAPYERASALNDIVLDNGELLGTGEVQYPSTAVFNLANKKLSARVHLVADKLLADGFE